MGIILTKSLTSSTGASGGGSGAYTDAEKLAMEIEMAFKAANLYNYKELTYTDSNLSAVDIYTNSSKSVKLFNKTLSYDLSGNLSELTVTRISPSADIVKTLSYDGSGNLFSITISGSEY